MKQSPERLPFYFGLRLLTFIGMSFFLLGAMFDEGIDSIRVGNQLYHAGDFTESEKYYQAAERTISDPGLCAYNRGIVASEQKRYRDAELLFRQCLGDQSIPPLRRVRAFYQLGNVLVEQSVSDPTAANPKWNAPLLRSAIESFQAALDSLRPDMLETEINLGEDIKHNLELAKLLWLKAKVLPEVKDNPNRESTNPPPEPKKEPKSEAKDPETGSQGSSKQSRPQLDPKAKIQKDKPKGIETTKQKTPGNGILPVLKDDGVVNPMPVDQTRSYLEVIAERLQRERLQNRQQAGQLPMIPD